MTTLALSVTSFENAKTELTAEVCYSLGLDIRKLHLPTSLYQDSEYHMLVAHPRHNMTLFSGWVRLETSGDTVRTVRCQMPVNERHHHSWRDLPVSWLKLLSPLTVPTHLPAAWEAATRLAEEQARHNARVASGTDSDWSFVQVHDANATLLAIDPDWHARTLRSDLSVRASNRAVFRTPGVHFKIPGLTIENEPYGGTLIITEIKNQTVHAVKTGRAPDDRTYIKIPVKYFDGAVQCPPIP